MNADSATVEREDTLPASVAAVLEQSLNHLDAEIERIWAQFQAKAKAAEKVGRQ